MDERECPRCSPPPDRFPRAELVGAIVALAWCAWFGWWLASGLQSVR